MLLSSSLKVDERDFEAEERSGVALTHAIIQRFQSYNFLYRFCCTLLTIYTYLFRKPNN